MTQRGAEPESLVEREGSNQIAALFGKPVPGTGGIVPPPSEYRPVIEAVFAKHDVQHNVDEVVISFGRLGSMFGSGHSGIRPDLVTIAKGLTSADALLADSVVSKRLWAVLEQGTGENGPFGHGWTCSAHPGAAAAGVPNLELIDWLDLISNAASVGADLNTAMADALSDHPNVGDIRGEALLCAVEFVEDKDSRTFFDPAKQTGPRIAANLPEQNKITARARPQGDTLGFAPPFCITKEKANLGGSATVQTVETTLGRPSGSAST